MKRSKNLLPATAYDTVHELARQMSGESDRGAVLVAAAMLDSSLKELLVRSLVPPMDEAQDALFRPNGAADSFSGKIELAFRTGLISRTVYKGLNLVREMRNRFAHSHDRCAFDNPEVIAHTQKLRLAVVLHDPRGIIEFDTAKDEFSEAASAMLIEIQRTEESSVGKRFESPRPLVCHGNLAST